MTYRKPPQQPVALPPNISHGAPGTAYNHYKCRCQPCKLWRQSYDRHYWESAQRQKQRNERKS